jgi:hypothetical protein
LLLLSRPFVNSRSNVCEYGLPWKISSSRINSKQ